MGHLTQLHSPSLDDLIFAQPPLASFAASQRSQQLSVHIDVQGGQRQVRLGSPWFIRNAPNKELGGSWPGFCGLMRTHGIAMFCPVEHFEKVSAGKVPLRFARRNALSPLLPTEMRSADAIELECFNADTGQWSWPAEVDSVKQLPRLLQSVRLAVGSNTPVGISIPLGITPQDLQVVMGARPDFITLDGSSVLHPHHPALLLDTLRRIRELKSAHAAEARTTPGELPNTARTESAILVISDVGDALHTLKLLALGATAVSIDSLVADSIVVQRPESTEYIGGMLSGIAIPSAPRNELAPFEKAFARLSADFSRLLAKLNVSQIAEVSATQLRALSPQTAQIAGVPLLTST